MNLFTQTPSIIVSAIQAKIVRAALKADKVFKQSFKSRCSGYTIELAVFNNLERIGYELLLVEVATGDKHTERGGDVDNMRELKTRVSDFVKYINLNNPTIKRTEKKPVEEGKPFFSYSFPKSDQTPQQATEEQPVIDENIVKVVEAYNSQFKSEATHVVEQTGVYFVYSDTLGKAVHMTTISAHNGKVGQNDWYTADLFKQIIESDLTNVVWTKQPTEEQPVSNRAELVITELPIDGKPHFQGLCTESKPIAIKKGERLFTALEAYLVSKGIAHNITNIEPLRYCGKSVDYKVTYNKPVKPEPTEPTEQPTTKEVLNWLADVFCSMSNFNMLAMVSFLKGKDKQFNGTLTNDIRHTMTSNNWIDGDQYDFIAMKAAFDNHTTEQSAIEEAKQLLAKHGTTNGLVPCVFKATRLDGVLHIGVCYQPSTKQVGDTFHYDHGVGINKNQDAKIVWIATEQPTDIFANWNDEQPTTGNGMTLEEIKTAVDNGLTVHWSNDAYTVIKDSVSQYLIHCSINDTHIGLTHNDGVTLNGRESQFYIKPKPTKQPLPVEFMTTEQVTGLNEQLPVSKDDKLNALINEHGYCKLEASRFIARLPEPTEQAPSNLFVLDDEHDTKQYNGYRVRFINSDGDKQSGTVIDTRISGVELRVTVDEMNNLPFNVQVKNVISCKQPEQDNRMLALLHRRSDTGRNDLDDRLIVSYSSDDEMLKQIKKAQNDGYVLVQWGNVDIKAIMTDEQLKAVLSGRALSWWYDKPEQKTIVKNPYQSEPTEESTSDANKVYTLDDDFDGFCVHFNSVIDAKQVCKYGFGLADHRLYPFKLETIQYLLGDKFDVEEIIYPSGVESNGRKMARCVLIKHAKHVINPQPTEQPTEKKTIKEGDRIRNTKTDITYTVERNDSGLFIKGGRPEGGIIPFSNEDFLARTVNGGNWELVTEPQQAA